MGQRMVELASSYTVAKDGSATIHVSQMPPNPNILTPGPAWMYVLVDGVPSIATEVLVGSGKIEKQKTLPVQELPTSTVDTTNTSSSQAASGSGSGSGSGSSSNAGSRLGVAAEVVFGALLFGVLFI